MKNTNVYIITNMDFFKIGFIDIILSFDALYFIIFAKRLQSRKTNYSSYLLASDNAKNSGSIRYDE